MAEYVVGSVAELFDLVDTIRGTKGWADAVLRGHRDPAWRLQPGLFRFAEQRLSPLPAGATDAEKEARDLATYAIESDLFFAFDARSRRETHDDGSGWEALFHMQHHGAPTRLLDFTENLLVALYFATHDWPTGVPFPADQTSAAIWVLAPSELNRRSAGVKDLIAPEYYSGVVAQRYTGRWADDRGESKQPNRSGYRDLLATCTRLVHGPVALFPNVLNYRMRAQQGTFVLFGERAEPLEAENGDVVRCITLTAAAVAEAKIFLRRAGVHIYSLNPDLDGLAAWLRLR